MFHHMPVHIGQATNDAVGADSELFMVDAEEVQDGGVHVVAGGEVLRGLVASRWSSCFGFGPLMVTMPSFL